MKNFQKIVFKWRLHILPKVIGSLRNIRYTLYGMNIGKKTFLSKINVTWPHQVKLGNSCNIEKGVYFKYDGIWKSGPGIIIGDNVFIGTNCEFNIKKKIIIGDYSLIASGTRFIDHDHGIQLTELIASQVGTECDIIIGRDVWIGCNVVVLKGVAIEDGAVVAAGAVVTKSIKSNEIWAGIPAKKIGNR